MKDNKKIVYVAGPFRGDTAWDMETNIRVAEEIAMDIAELGAVPLVPYTMYRFFNGTPTDSFWLDATLELLRRCDAAVFCGSWEESTGSLKEMELAITLGLPTFVIDDEMVGFLCWLNS